MYTQSSSSQLHPQFFLFFLFFIVLKKMTFINLHSIKAEKKPFNEIRLCPRF